jgi:hypothetical protein
MPETTIGVSPTCPQPVQEDQQTGDRPAEDPGTGPGTGQKAGSDLPPPGGSKGETGAPPSKKE